MFVIMEDIKAKLWNELKPTPKQEFHKSDQKECWWHKYMVTDGDYFGRGKKNFVEQYIILYKNEKSHYFFITLRIQFMII